VTCIWHKLYTNYVYRQDLLFCEWAERILSWRHTGFNVHSRVRAKTKDYAVVDKIIDHLKLTFVADKPPPPHIAYQEVLMAADAPIYHFLRWREAKLVLERSSGLRSRKQNSYTSIVLPRNIAKGLTQRSL